MIDPELLERLRCMQTGSLLVVATESQIESVNRAIEQGIARDQLGRAVTAVLEGGLVNEQQTVLYPITDGVVQMLQEESIDLGFVTTGQQ